MTINLPNNANQLVKAGNYYALAIKGVFDNANDPELAFVPLNPVRTTGHVLVWRKNYTLTSAATKFLQESGRSDDCPPIKNKRGRSIFAPLPFINGCYSVVFGCSCSA